MYEESKTQYIKKLIKEHIDEFEKKGIYSLFNSEYVKKIFAQEIPCYKLSNYYDVFLKCDLSLQLSKESGELLEKLFNNQSKNIGIYETVLDKKALESDTLRNNIQYGFQDGNNKSLDKLSEEISFPKNFVNFMLTLKTISDNFGGCFIFSFPKDLVNENGYVNSQEYHRLYDCYNGVTYIKPDFIIGYIDTDSPSIDYIPKEEIITKQKTLQKTTF